MGDSAIVEGARARALALLGQRLSDAPALVRDGLERHDRHACDRLGALLHEVRATLILLGRPAIALVAADAARVVEAVAAGTLVERPANGPEDLLCSVLGAHEALSDVVAEAAEARRAADVPDTALPALAVLNGLRALLGAPFLSEALLLALDINVDVEAEGDSGSGAPDAALFAAPVRAMRPRLMRQLIEWFEAINADDAERAASATASLASLIGSLADDARAAGLSIVDRDVLSAAAGIAEAVSTRRLPDDGAVRRLFAQFERWLVDRWVAPRTPGDAPRVPPRTLLRNQLYYVAVATPPHEDRVWSDLVERYSLGRVARLARTGSADAGARSADPAASVRPPGRRLRSDVVSRVRDDLHPLADWLAQGGRTPADRAVVQRGERLRELLPVFELLGAQRCRHRLSEALSVLDRGGAARLTEQARLDVARQFVLFDEALTDFERGAPRPVGTNKAAGSFPGQGAALSLRMASVGGSSGPAGSHLSGRRDAADALIVEARRRLGDCENSLERAMGADGAGPSPESLALRLRHVARALDILPRPEASALIDRLADIVGWLPAQGSASMRQAVAEYVVSIDACLASDGRHVPGDAADPLDAAERALTRLEGYLPAASAIGDALAPSMLQRDGPSPAPGASIEKASAGGEATPTEQALDAFSAIGAALAEESPDVGALSSAFAAIRLAARDVGHEQLERLASAAGRRLSLSPTPLSGATASAILDAHLALPQLIEGLSDPASAPLLDDLDDTLRALDVDPLADPPARPLDPAAAVPMSPPLPAASMEPEGDDPMDATLRDVFVIECAQHVATLEHELAAASSGPARVPPSDRLLRALHTLSGSARTASAGRVDEIARPLHRAGMALQARADVFDETITDVFREAVAGIERARQAFAEGLDIRPPHEDLLRRLAVIEAGDARSAAPPSAVRTQRRDSLDEIFAEEARDLLDRLAALAEGPGPHEHRTDRALATLHTLKGSARVAGQPRLADRAHEAESEVAATVSDRACSERLRVVRRELDALLVSPAREPVAAPAASAQRVVAPPAAASPVDVPLSDRFYEASSSSDAGRGDQREQGMDAIGASGWQATDLSRIEARTGAEATPSDEAPELTRVRERDWERLMTLAQDIAGSQARLSAELVRLQDASRELELAAQRWRRLPAAATVLETEAARELLNDLGSVRVTLRDALRAVDTEQRRGARAGIALQQDLVRARLVRFDACRTRLERTLADAAAATHREARLHIDGGAITLDATLHGRLLPALEHLVRNAIVHGIEAADEREAAGKPRSGQVRLGVSIEGVDIVILVDDDGRGIDARRVAERLAVPAASLDANAALLDALAVSGFSTVDDATEIGGHGIGVAAVRERLDELGGRLRLSAARGELGGARFEVRLPQRIPVQQVVLVRAGELVAIPVNVVGSIEQLSVDAERDTPLSDLLGHQAPSEDPDERGAWRRLHLTVPGEIGSVLVEAVIGYREIVVQSLDVQLASLKRYTGVAALPDGRRVFVIDPAMLDTGGTAPSAPEPEAASTDRPLALVADDSPTQRAWSTETFESLGYRVLVTRDGREALDALEHSRPDVMLLDVDMPRVDGFGVLEALQKSGGARFPILMLTSRHSARDRSAALAFGAADFLAKPGSRDSLLDALTRAGAPAPVATQG